MCDHRNEPGGREAAMVTIVNGTAIWDAEKRALIAAYRKEHPDADS